MSIQSITYGKPESVQRGVGPGLKALSVDSSRAVTVRFPSSVLLLEPLPCTVKGLSLLHIGCQLTQEDGFYIEAGRRNSLLVVLQGAVLFSPAKGMRFDPFSLLPGQFAWLPMDPADYRIALPGEKTCRVLELHCSANLVKRWEPLITLIPFQSWCCSLPLLDSIDQYFQDPVHPQGSPLLWDIFMQVATSAREPVLTDLPLIELLFDVRNYLHQHSRINLDMYDLLRQAGTNENKLRSGFKDVFGISVKKYHEYLRIEEAKKILQKGNRSTSIASAGVAVGYRRRGTFINAFSRQTGLTPGSWIKDVLKVEKRTTE